MAASGGRNMVGCYRKQQSGSQNTALEEQRREFEEKENEGNGGERRQGYGRLL